MQILLILQRILRPLADICVWILEAVSTLALICITFSFGWLVFGRYVLNDTPTWVEHTTIILIGVITFLMMAANQKHGKNLAVGILIDRIAPGPRAYALAAIDILVVIMGITIAIYGYRLAIFNASQRIPMLGISEGIRMIPLMVGGAALALFSTVDAIERITNTKSEEGGSDAPLLDPSSIEINGD